MGVSAVLAFVLVLSTLPFNGSANLPIEKQRPACHSRKSPPRMLFVGNFSSEPNTSDKNETVAYSGHYCYPGKEVRWCLRPPLGYKQVNCTVTYSDGVHVKCNMTSRKLYNGKMCMVISASNKSETTFTKSRCCYVTYTKFSPIENLKLKASGKGQINVTWSKPSDVDYYTMAFVQYIFRLTMADNTYIVKTFIVSPNKPRSPHFFYIIKNLKPYTRYRLTGAVFTKDREDDGIPSKPIEVRTLPEAPSVPPVITEVLITSQNETRRTVNVEWKHPPKEKRNGIIYQTIIEINHTLPFYDKIVVSGNGTKASISGLDLHKDYVLWLRSCTTPLDCSVRSDNITLKGIAQTPSASKRSKILSLAFILSLIFLAIASGILSIVCLAFCLKRRAKRDAERENSKSLDPLPPDITDVRDESDIEQPLTEDNVYTVAEVANHDQAPMLQLENNADQATVSDHQSSEEIPLC